MSKTSFAKEVWDKLSSINVNEHVEKKNGLSFLSWAWAWGTLMEHYPESEYEFHPEVHQDDGSVTVWVTVTVKEGDRQLSRNMWLPVMDHRNNAIVKPDARKISDSRMRCLTKCLAIFGLGHYIYAGEDIPTEEAKAKTATITKQQAEELRKAMTVCGMSEPDLCAKVRIKSLEELQASRFEGAMNYLKQQAQESAA